MTNIVEFPSKKVNTEVPPAIDGALLSLPVERTPTQITAGIHKVIRDYLAGCPEIESMAYVISWKLPPSQDLPQGGLVSVQDNVYTSQVLILANKLMNMATTLTGQVSHFLMKTLSETNTDAARGEPARESVEEPGPVQS